MGIAAPEKKREIAIGIALQTHVLKTCPVHNRVYCGDEETEDENIARAFSVAIELVRQNTRFAADFHHDTHELTDLLSYTIGAAPLTCPECACRPQPGYSADNDNRV